MKRAAIYPGVSTHNGQNPEMQLGEVRAYGARRRWEVAQEYVAAGIRGRQGASAGSGRSTRRLP